MIEGRQRVLILGAAGQLGCELQYTAPTGFDVCALPRRELDLCDLARVSQVLTKLAPNFVINAAAYTAVDRAETEPEKAYAANRDAPAHLADECAARGIRLLHISTDFVFDGCSGEPYHVDAQPQPLGVYGASKLAGEAAVLASGADALIVRAGWVYSRHGGNFVKTMLKLMAERDALNVVEDQIGTPTWARGLAKTCWQLLQNPNAFGVYHWSDAGACSWYDFAVAIFEEATALGLLTRDVAIGAIPASEYPTPAQRPSFSVLDKSKTRALTGEAGHQWRQQLRVMLSELRPTKKD